MIDVSGFCQTNGCTEFGVVYGFIFSEGDEIIAVCGACRNFIANLQVND
jgi:cytidine deaminase